jgi:hypothetical protein
VVDVVEFVVVAIAVYVYVVIEYVKIRDELAL